MSGRRRHRHVPEPLYPVPGPSQPDQWTVFALERLDRFVRCRACRRIGIRTGRTFIEWVSAKEARGIAAEVSAWKRTVFSLV